MKDGNADRSDKHTKSEERRVQSLLEKREFERRRQSVVSDTLKKIDSNDGTGLNKKIRFDSDSDNDDNDLCTPSTATTSKVGLTNGSTSNGVTSIPSSSTSKTKKPALFDDDDEDEGENGEDGKEDGEMFALKPHFFGKKGEELMALEARYGGDERFKLNDKFLDEEEQAAAAVPMDAEQLERQQEKKNALGILERVLGHNLRKKNDDEEVKGPSSTTTGGRPLLVRFDPNNPAHERYDLAKANKAEESSSSSSEEEEHEEESPKKVQETLESVAKEPKHVPSYHMDSSFAEALRARLAQSADAQNDQPAQPFSLLSSLGRQVPSDSQPTPSKPNLPFKTQEIPRLEKWQSINSHLVDSSDEEGDVEEKIDKSKSVTVDASKATGASCFFFLDADDPTVAKTVQRFRRTEDIEVVKRKWSKFRESIVKCYKRQKKMAVRAVKAKEREKYRNHDGQNVNSQQQSEDGGTARDRKTFPRRSSTMKQPQQFEKHSDLKAKRLAKRKRRIATKKTANEPVNNDAS